MVPPKVEMTGNCSVVLLDMQRAVKMVEKWAAPRVGTLVLRKVELRAEYLDKWLVERLVGQLVDKLDPRMVD